MSLDTELDFAKQLANEAGAVMKQYFDAGVQRDWRADATPVTPADIEINRLVIERVASQFPDHNVRGEEEINTVGGSLTWVCDPVDGTMPFSHGLPISSFSLALVDDGQPVVAVVYEPFVDRCFWAKAGEGAFLNGEPIRVSANGFDNALIEIDGFPSTHPVLDADAGFLTALHKRGAHVTALWSVILPTALIAAGQYTASVFNVNKPEDAAAIKLIVEEAGGKVTDLFGREQRYDQPINGFVASNGVIHDELIDMLSAYPRIG